MTSPFTDDITRKFFESRKYFGLEADQVRSSTFFFSFVLTIPMEFQQKIQQDPPFTSNV